MRLWFIVAMVAATLLVGVGASYGDDNAPGEVKKGKTHKQARVRESCPAAHVGLLFYRTRYARHMMSMGKQIDVEFETPRSCARARFLAKRWITRAYEARMLAIKWKYLLRDFAVTPGNDAWRKAVAEVQKVYPGTDSWLLSCSDSEGGWGRWVGYGGVSYSPSYTGVGGWLQFLPGTFWRMFDAANEDLAGRRFNVPASAASWTSALGQALAGAWGVTHGRKGEWSGYGCR